MRKSQAVLLKVYIAPPFDLEIPLLDVSWGK
jgi:hypothetical protein